MKSILQFLFCLLLAGCSGDRRSAVVEPSPTPASETARELKRLLARNPGADHYSLYWVTNCMYVSSIEEHGSTQAPVRVEMSAEAFLERHPRETNWMTYVTADGTLVVVGTTGTLAWFDRVFTTVAPEFMKRIRAQQPRPRDF